MRATFCAIVKRMEKAAGEPSGAAADLGAALDGAAVEAEEAADGAAATAPPSGDLAAPAVLLLLLMSVSDAPPAGDEACRVVVCWLVA